MTLAKHSTWAMPLSICLVFWQSFFAKCHKPNTFDCLISRISTPPIYNHYLFSSISTPPSYNHYLVSRISTPPIYNQYFFAFIIITPSPIITSSPLHSIPLHITPPHSTSPHPTPHHPTPLHTIPLQGFFHSWIWHVSMRGGFGRSDMAHPSRPRKQGNSRQATT